MIFLSTFLLLRLQAHSESKFQDAWLADDKFKDWIQRDSSDVKAYCKWCCKSISIYSMGRQALVSHGNGAKHVSKGKTSMPRVTSFFRPVDKAPTPSTSRDASMDSSTADVEVSQSESTVSFSRNSQSHAGLDAFVQTSDVLRAEILWCLKSTMSNYSYNSQEDTSDVFKKMFPDSEIAQKFSCGKTKTMYLSCFGIAPHFTDLLKKQVKDEHYVLLYDESLNVQLQSKQLDIHLRFWNDNLIETRYFSSDFLGHSCATDILASFDKLVKDDIGMAKLMQVSMDGPNVNLSALRQLQSDMMSEYDRTLIDVGTCSLHTMHNGFRHGVDRTNWDLSKFLSGVHTLFRDVPARRSEFEIITETDIYPLQYCAHRWVENVKVCRRIIEIFPTVSKYVDAVQRKETRNPATKSFALVKNWSADPLALAKLHFIVSIGEPIEAFLKMYQTDEPMLPYLSKDIEMLLRSLMERFIKTTVLENATTLKKLLSIDVSNRENHKSVKKIHLGFAVSNELAQFKEATEDTVTAFRRDCRNFLETFLNHVMEKTPLDNRLVKHIKCLNPEVLAAETTEVTQEDFKFLLDCLLPSKFILLKDCDKILDQWRAFTRDVRTLDDFKHFSRRCVRLDSLYYDTLHDSETYEMLWPVIRLLLTLSHGQATVERGFSVNKETSTVNISRHGLIARRTIKDHMEHSGGLSKFVVSDALLNSAKHARRGYEAHLARQKSLEQHSKCNETKKSGLQDQLKFLNHRLTSLRRDVDVLTADAEKLYEQAERTRDFAHLAEANAWSRAVKDKQQQISILETEKCRLLEEVAKC